MTDAITRLNIALEGRYRIERELGEGGMATVYLADDLKHGRKVALKVLKPELAAVIGPERFLAEIRTTASLQHPHILPLFDSGEVDSCLFYVMPFVEGETIRDRLHRQRPLPVDEAVQIARNVAEALDYAHRRGVIHRDIKPANILLQDGKPVLSDFGIALAVGVAGGSRLTETGLSLGTPQYMSPEQATGDMTVGVETDIYALSCVLYEMLVGEPPYTGSTTQVILGRIIAAEPASAARQRKSVPPNVDSAMRKALEKLPADRFPSAGAFASALADPDFRYGNGVVHRAVASGPWNRLSMGLAVVATLLFLTSVWSVSRLLRRDSRAVARFIVTPPEAQRLVRASGVDIALNPGGTRIVYVGVAPDGNTQLWQRRLDDLEATPIAGTEGAFAPDLSPDGESVAFGAEGAIRTISLLGGPPLTIVALGAAPRWGPDGFIYFSRAGTIHRVAAGGGDPEPVTRSIENVDQKFPDPLPNGRGLLFSANRGTPAETRIAVTGPDDDEVREILTGTMARYVSTGHIVYASADGTLLAAPFDVRRLEVTGPSVAFVQGVAVNVDGATQFALSSSGNLVYRIGPGVVSELVWVNRDGLVTPVDPGWTGEFVSPALSPDGTRLAVAVQNTASRDVWVKQLDRGPSTRLTFDGSRNDYPAWTPDGLSVTYASNLAGPSFDLWTKRADGTARAVLELDMEWALAEAVWSPDGEWFVHRTSTNAPRAGDIVAHRRGQPGTQVPLVATRFTELAPAISPNGRWMAYSSNETGRTEIYVVPFPNAGDAKWPVSSGGGTEPLWSRAGDEIFYRNGQGDVVAVRVDTGTTFATGPTSVLFSAAAYPGLSTHRQYDVTPDGKRFIMIRRLGGGIEGQLIFVQNFFNEMRARAPR
jgi:eukaryotic-like serine/threonine-protein kinase